MTHRVELTLYLQVFQMEVWFVVRGHGGYSSTETSTTNQTVSRLTTSSVSTTTSTSTSTNLQLQNSYESTSIFYKRRLSSSFRLPEQYYVSQETQGVIDLLQNIDKYVNVDNLTNLVSNAELRNDIDSVDTDIVVEDNTDGFVDKNGLIKIGDEIIMYESKN